MKVEQILYTRMGGSELGAGWQSRTSEKFDADAVKGCTFVFNCMVDSLLDKTLNTPEYIYSVWHSNKRLFVSRAKKLSDQAGRGNILAQAYTVSESEYISVLSNPQNITTITDFSDEMVEKPEVLDALPSCENISLKEICQKYSISASKMQQLLTLIMSAVLRKNVHKKALKIIVDKPDEELYQTAREVMAAVYSFMPCFMGLNTSFSSFAHPQLENMAILFTNKPQDGYYYNLITGEWSWPADKLIPNTGISEVFVENRRNQSFQKDMEDYVLSTGSVYNIQWDGAIAAFLYSAIKNNIKFKTDEDELFRAIAAAIKNTSTGIQEDYLAYIVKHYIDCGGKISSSHSDLLTARYEKTKNENLKEAIIYYTFGNFVNDYADQKFSKFCALQKAEPDIYEKIVKISLDNNKTQFLNKICDDITKSKDTYAAFINSVSPDTKSRIFKYMLENVLLAEDGSGYERFSLIRRRIPQLHEELHRAAMSNQLSSLKKYYTDYAIPYAADSLDTLQSIREMFASRFDDEMRAASVERALNIFELSCKEGCSPNAYVKFKNVLHKLNNPGSSADTVQYENKAKDIFWQNFSLSSWKQNESYAMVANQAYPASKEVAYLESIIKKLKDANPGDTVYVQIIDNILSGSRYSGEDKRNIILQIKNCASMKTQRHSIDDYILTDIDENTGRVNMSEVGNQLTNGRMGISPNAITNSPMMAYAVARGASKAEVGAMYEIIVTDTNLRNSKIPNAVKLVCERNGVSMKQLDKDLNKKSKNSFSALAGLLTVVSLCSGLGLFVIFYMFDVPFKELELMGYIIKMLVILLLSGVITVPVFGIIKQMNARNGLLAVLTAAVYVFALVLFGYCFNIAALCLAFTISVGVIII